MKSQIRALADVRIFQAIVYDSKSRKRLIAVYACGDDIAYADDAVGLFDRDRRRVAPEWLKKQLRLLPEGGVRFDWQGNKTHKSFDDNVEHQVPVGDAQNDAEFDAPRDATPIVRVPAGADFDLGGESTIQQG